MVTDRQKRNITINFNAYSFSNHDKDFHSFCPKHIPSSFPSSSLLIHLCIHANFPNSTKIDAIKSKVFKFNCSPLYFIKEISTFWSRLKESAKREKRDGERKSKLLFLFDRFIKWPKPTTDNVDNNFSAGLN